MKDDNLYVLFDPKSAEPLVRECFVEGLPAPQGSMRAFVVKGRALLTSDNPRTQGWRQAVAWAVRAVYTRPVVAHPTGIAIFLDFVLPRPKSKVYRGRTWATAKPDLDKLVRAVLDALTGVVYEDDKQVVAVFANKKLTITDDAGEPVGVTLTVLKVGP